MSESRRMSAEVAHLAASLVGIVGCAGCGTGIAVDAVAERYGHERIDWRCPSDKCVTSKYGTTPKQNTEIAALIATLPPANAGPTPSGAAVPDARLPPERDESDRTPL